jgi:hypothetical protein
LLRDKWLCSTSAVLPSDFAFDRIRLADFNGAKFTKWIKSALELICWR